MRRLILVAAAPNRFARDHGVELGKWVITDPRLSRVDVQVDNLIVREIKDAHQGVMRCDPSGRESCFLTNPQDPLYHAIRASAQRGPGRGVGDNIDTFGPVFKLSTEYGIVRWFVATASGRHAIRDMPLHAGSSFNLTSTLVQSNAGYSYYVPRIMA